MVDGGNSDRLILVSGATGSQGGSVARALLGKGFRVSALTRNMEKPAAKSLSESGAKVVSGDLEDRSSLDAALDGVYGVFSVQQFFEDGYEGEVRQGKRSLTRRRMPAWSIWSKVSLAARTGTLGWRISRVSAKSRSTCREAGCDTRSCAPCSS